MCLLEAWFINKMIRFAYLREIGDDYKIILRRRSANCLSLTNSLCGGRRQRFWQFAKKGDHVIFLQVSTANLQKELCWKKHMVPEDQSALETS